jgi:solute carrier family 25 uncoupling protein 27
VAKEGMLSLYKGFVPSWLRMAPWSLAYFLTFEQMRLAAGMGSF